MAALRRRRDVAQQPIDFAAFYEGAKDDCLRAVYASTGNRHLAEELVAEAFARAWASWRKVARHPAPRAWVVRTALNAHVSWWRRRRREVPWTGQDGPVGAAGPADADGRVPDATLMAALRELPTRQRQVVALRIFLDLDTETTAESLGITAGTVTAHLARATRSLRAQLSPTNQKETSSP
jgi:RNA polymerase sigma-70 factor (sigma-E family)